MTPQYESEKDAATIVELASLNSTQSSLNQEPFDNVDLGQVDYYNAMSGFIKEKTTKEEEMEGESFDSFDFNIICIVIVTYLIFVILISYLCYTKCYSYLCGIYEEYPPVYSQYTTSDQTVSWNALINLEAKMDSCPNINETLTASFDSIQIAELKYNETTYYSCIKLSGPYASWRANVTALKVDYSDDLRLEDINCDKLYEAVDNEIDMTKLECKTTASIRLNNIEDIASLNAGDTFRIEKSAIEITY